MRVIYGSRSGNSHRYYCRSRDFDDPDQPCIGVGGVKIDRAVAERIVSALSPEAIDAAELAVHQARERAEDALTDIRRELEEAQYEARLAARLPEIWNADAADPRLKQRVAQILIRHQQPDHHALP